MMNRRQLFGAMLALPLAGCGFRLRGSDPTTVTLPPELQLVTDDPYGSMAATLTRDLTSRSVTLVTDNAPILRISGLLESQRVLGPVVRSGVSVDQIELVTTLDYRLDGPDRSPWIPETTVQASVIYVEGAIDNSNEAARIQALRSRLLTDVIAQVIPSLSLRYGQWLSQGQGR